MGNENLERLLDLIADAIIQSDIPELVEKINESQKFIRNGKIQQGAGEGVLALFQKDIKANQEDLINSLNVSVEGEDVQQNLQEIADNINFDLIEIEVTPNGAISIVGGGPSYDGLSLTNLLTDLSTNNPLNVSQFISLTNQQSNINIEQAEEFLDTNIFELLPSGDARQARIIRFFQELNTLLPPRPGTSGQPPFDFPDDDDNMVNRDENFNWVSASLYDKNTSISYVQDNQDGNINEEEAFIHRLKSTANDTNSSRTIEDIYNTILPYLTDILEDEISPQDDRPIYENQSSGYLKFRNLNQGIIIRNTNKEFIEGLDPNNLTYLNRLDENGDTIPGTGFTITMWVRFLDKVSEGTLFNFGNPILDENPFGFKLETYVLNKNDVNPDTNQPDTWGETVNQNQDLIDSGIFQNSNSARFVRLLVREYGSYNNTVYDPGLRTSALCVTGLDRITWNPADFDLDTSDYNQADETRLLLNTLIPEDFNEWYFICASYNPSVIEPTNASDNQDQWNAYKQIPEYWLNHITPNVNNEDNTAITPHQYTNFSGFGNKCKVEIISRSDLLRARGFKVD